MKVLGLTGGIGSGKSTVAAFFRELGVPVYDSDREAKLLMTENEDIRAEVMALFGEEAYQGSSLNRSYISSKVFADPKLLEQLNAIVHPRVRMHFKEWAVAQDAPYVLQEAAILFENGAHKQLDAMILVWAPKESRIQRVMERDNIDREAILARMQNQWDDAETTALADYIIENIDRSETQRQVARLHSELLENMGVTEF